MQPKKMSDEEAQRLAEERAETIRLRDEHQKLAHQHQLAADNLTKKIGGYPPDVWRNRRERRALASKIRRGVVRRPQSEEAASA